MASIHAAKSNIQDIAARLYDSPRFSASHVTNGADRALPRSTGGQMPVPASSHASGA
jgi:hypothetical protein